MNHIFHGAVSECRILCILLMQIKFVLTAYWIKWIWSYYYNRLCSVNFGVQTQILDIKFDAGWWNTESTQKIEYFKSNQNRIQVCGKPSVWSTSKKNKIKVHLWKPKFKPSLVVNLNIQTVTFLTAYILWNRANYLKSSSSDTQENIRSTPWGVHNLCGIV